MRFKVAAGQEGFDFEVDDGVPSSDSTQRTAQAGDDGASVPLFGGDAGSFQSQGATSARLDAVADDDGCAECLFPQAPPVGESETRATAGSSSVDAAKPVGTIAQLADYLVNGFWQWTGDGAHHWGTTTIT